MLLHYLQTMLPISCCIGFLWFGVSLHKICVVHSSCVCQIQSETGTVNCSNKKLKKIPDCAPDSTETFLLSKNRFKTLSGSPFERFTVLRYLDISFNDLLYLNYDAFTGLSHLQTLILTSNPLYFKTSFSKTVFQPLKNLEELHIEGIYAYNRYAECSYIDDQLSRVPSLKRIYLDGCSRQPFGPGFSKLDNLEEIHMDGLSGFCSMDILNNNTFASLRNISVTKIFLRSCDINIIHPHTFAGLKNLSALSLHHNRILCEQGLTNLTIGLNTTSLKFLNVSQICRYSQFNISPETLRGFLGTEIESLDIAQNKLETIHPKAILMLPKTLKYLSLRDNSINDVHFLINMKVLTSLTILDASFQSHYGANTPNFQSYYPFKNAEQNNKVVLIKKYDSRAYASDLGKFWKNLFSSNDVAESGGNESINSGDNIVLPINLRILNISFIKMEYPIIPLNFDPNNSLEILDISNDLFSVWLGPWKGLQKLKVLNITNNKMEKIQPNSFSYMNNLRELLLGQNKLGWKMNQYNYEKMFWNLKRLDKLCLSQNNIRDLPKKIFTRLKNLTSLSLADNALINLRFHVDSLVSLQTLDLSGNQIQAFSKQLMQELDKLSENTDIEINLEKNLLACDCDTIDFVAWLTTTKINIKKHNISCQYTNKTMVDLLRIAEIYDRLSAECDAWIIVLSCIVGFVVLNLILSLIAIIYYKRWNFKYLFYMGRQHLNPYHPIEGRAVKLEYDVYISYERDQMLRQNLTLHEFMTQNIYTKLKDQGLRVIIRDELDIGKRQYDIIPQALRKCRKVIALVSKEYCSDVWNVYEFNMAALEGIYTKRQVLIPIVIGSVDEENLTSDLYAFLKPQIIPRYKITTPETALTDYILEAVRH